MTMGNSVATGGSSKRVEGSQASPDVTASLPRFVDTPTPSPVPVRVPLAGRAEIILRGAPGFHPSVNGRNGWSMDEVYDVGDELGRGSFGRVYCSSHTQNQSIVTAVKVTMPTSLDRNAGPLVGYDGIEARCQEVRALLKLQGGNRILQLYEIFWNGKELHIVTERLSMDLNEWIKGQGPDFDENMAKKVTQKLLYAIAFMHKRGVVHRDMKPHNIMFTVGDDSRSDCRSLKIIDFGMAKVLENETEKTADFCGTLGFLAPEIYQRLPYRFEVDMFAVGVILFRMLSGGEKPFPSERLRDATLELNYNFESDSWGSDLHLESAKNLIQNLLCFRTVRLDATKALDHKWLKPTKNSIRLTSTFITVEEDATGACMTHAPSDEFDGKVFPANTDVPKQEEKKEEKEEYLGSSVRSVRPTHLPTSKKACWLCLAIVVLVSVILGGVCGAGKCSSGPGPTANPNPPIIDPPTPTPSGGGEPSSLISDAPTSAFPSSPPTIGSIDDFLATLPEYTRAELWNPMSPQSKALDWIKSGPYFNNLTWQRQTARFVLATLYHATDGDSWSNHDLWLTPSHECEWFSVACPDGELLTNLRLQNILMTGTIPTELALLTDLTELDLSSNNLNGTIPTELSLLINLQLLHLSANLLSGTIPTELALLGDLAELELFDNNDLNGTIPTELARLANLQTLNLWGNLLSGTIPTEFALLADLAVLVLYDNGLNGTIPTELALLTNLQLFYLWGNHLSGTIPTELASLTDLTEFELSSNNLNGTIPTELALLTNLQLLYPWDNLLSGTIPTELALLTDLTAFEFSNNNLNGTIPTELSLLTNLQLLNLSSNLLSGTIPTELALLTDLTALVLNDNKDLNGTIPTELARLANLQQLHLWRNHFSGTIPTEFALLAVLVDLALFDNKYMNGTIPTELARLANLQILNLWGNLLSGTIPTELASLTDLAVFSLEDNGMNGTIPTEFALLRNLQVLYLKSNLLSGTIPTELALLTNLTTLELSSNNLNGTIPTELAYLANLQVLYLSSNLLSGTIPSGLCGRNVEIDVFNTLVQCQSGCCV